MQSIMIGQDIKITVVKIERNQVRIGINAPRDLIILRDELTDFLPGDTREDHEELPAASGLSV
jgi:carbon storage regulator